MTSHVLSLVSETLTEPVSYVRAFYSSRLSFAAVDGGYLNGKQNRRIAVVSVSELCRSVRDTDV